MSSESDDDYMSDAILNQCKDVRPGLVFNSSTKRKFEAEKKHDEANKRSRQKPRVVIEKETREIGLNTPINEDNKGFMLLKKMGFQPGTSLGTDTRSALKVPLGIQVKSGREGLGRDALNKEKHLVAKHSSNGEDPVLLINRFRETTRDKLSEKRIFGDLLKSQRLCRQLDLAEGIVNPNKRWYWPKEEVAVDNDQEDEKDSSEDESDDEDKDFMQRLNDLTEYLRSRHCYCIWCGVKYRDNADMLQDCPGGSYQAHQEDE